MATREQLADEAARARKVRHLVDLATSLIIQSEMSRREAQQLVAAMRQRILDLFPDGEGAFEVIYARRFKRLIDEFTKPDPLQSGVVVRFPSPPR